MVLRKSSNILRSEIAFRICHITIASDLRKQASRACGNFPPSTRQKMDSSSSTSGERPALEKTSDLEQKDGTLPQMSRRAMKRLKRKESRKKLKKPALTRNLNPGYGKAMFSETEYYFENGLRKVYPYYFTFETYAKERWVGKTVLEVFTEEFLSDTPEHYKQIIESGKVRINDKPMSLDYRLKNNDKVAHEIHRHENPVIGTPIQILEDDDDVVVINKPSSIPCHPCGRYRNNSVVFILGKEFGYTHLRNIYRLDRLTSGVLICAKTPERTRELEDQVLRREVEKEYVCRVVGKFPDGIIEVDKPLSCISHKISLWMVNPSGKPSKTTFERLSYTGESSVVRCIPYTGRTHQIRVHLQYLGHPIVNDPFYNAPAWGPNRGKDGKFEIPLEKITEEIMKTHNIGMWVEGDNVSFYQRLEELKESRTTGGSLSSKEDCDGVSTDQSEMRRDIGVEPTNKRQKLAHNCGSSNNERYPKFDPSLWVPDKDCQDCRKKYIDPQKKDLVMYLHALRYKGKGWEYKSDLPEWAKEDWREDS